MATASYQTQPNGHSHGKLTKSRNSIVVKPILKKLQAHSHSHARSERTSLDLRRGWDDQPVSPRNIAFGSLDYGAREADDSGRHLFSTASGYVTAVPSAPAGGVASMNGPKAVRDVSFTLSSTDLGSGTGAAAAIGGGSAAAAAAAALASKYSHARSTSGGSVATTTSGRNGTFIHPFQQIPRTSTPPLSLSYANSVASLDTTAVASRDYSLIASGGADNDIEDGDESLSPYLPQSPSYPFHSSTAATRKHLPPPPVVSNPNHSSNPRRPSLASSQRTSSLSDGGQSFRATVAASRSNSGPPVLRVTPGSVNQSRSDLPISPLSSANDSPLSGTPTPQMVSCPLHTSSNPIMSPLRNSLDMSGFRIRSRSDIDTATRQEQVREARRKFEAKEREKEEKYAREQIRRRERADAKEAQKFERAQAQFRKGSVGGNSISSGRNSSSTDIRPAASAGSREKSAAFSSRSYDGVAAGQTPSARADDVHFRTATRSKSAKRKTNGVWTAFVLWLRTRLLKMGRR